MWNFQKRRKSTSLSYRNCGLGKSFALFKVLIKEKAYVTVRLLQSVVLKDASEQGVRSHKVTRLCTGFSFFLYSRNHTLSRLQYTIGLLLDQCGATKEIDWFLGWFLNNSFIVHLACIKEKQNIYYYLFHYCCFSVW